MSKDKVNEQPGADPKETSSRGTGSQRHTRSRRKLLKTLATTGGGVVVAKALPDQWVKPIADAVILPAHAVVSGGNGAFTADVEVASNDDDIDFTPRTFGVGVHTFGDGTDDGAPGDGGDQGSGSDGGDTSADTDVAMDDDADQDAPDDDAPGDDPDDDIEFLVSGNAPDGATVNVDFDISGPDASDVDTSDALLDEDVVASGGSYSLGPYHYDDLADAPDATMTVAVASAGFPDCVIVINFRDR